MYSQPYIELDYNHNDEARNYRINLVTVPSNLGKGNIYYFKCPFTEKRCRKLYLIGGYFSHRDNTRYAMYESQTENKHYRGLTRLYGAYFELDRLYEQLYKKHFKKTYAGKPTNRYLKLMTKIQQAERIPYSEIERAMMR